MKKVIKTLSVSLSFLLLTLCFTLVANADVGFDGINYSIDSENQTAAVKNIYGSGKNITIPEYVYGFEVVAIEPYAFSGADIENVSIPETVLSIGTHAFSTCTELKRITIPESVTSMGQYVFSGCSKLESVSLLANIETIEMNTFESCKMLNQVTLAESITKIGNSAFNKCESLEVFPFENICEISANAFSNSGLKEVTIPSTVTKLNNMVFSNCGNLEYVEIPSSVSFIAFNTFRNVGNLTLGVWYGSYGHEYAIAQDLSYVLLDGVKLGDASGDGSVNINDVTTIQRYLAELETLEGIYLHAADANQDGTVDIADATIIQMYLAEYEMEYPIGKVMTQ